jgi:hypothetical protein
MDQRDRKELLGESRFSSVFSPLLESRWIWAEAAAIPLIALALCWWANPQDPFFVNSQFPWLWLAPVLVSLRYGVFPGIGSSLILLAAWFTLNGQDAVFPKLYFLGGVILTMVCGEYSGTWRVRLRRIGELNAYLTERFSRITRQLNMLRLSHDQLEHDLISKPSTLRDAIYQLRVLVSGKTAADALPAAQEVLAFLAQHCQIEAAALYQNRGGEFVACARVGEPPPLKVSDALWTYSLETDALAHIQTEGLNKRLPTEHLVVAPVRTSAGEVLGYLVVSQMPFFALNEDALQVLSLLLGLYADGVVVAPEVKRIIADFPDCSFEFSDEMAKLMRIQREYRINSHAVMLVFGDHPERDDMLLAASRLKRRFDVHWRTATHDARAVLINLMPLAGEPAVQGYLDRMEMSLKEQFGGNFVELRVRASVISLADDQPLAAVRRAITDSAR